MNHLSLKLKKLRKFKGLNQDELAQILGVGKTTISNYETGYTTPPSATLRELAFIFGVSVDDLLNEMVTVDDLLNKMVTIDKILVAPASKRSTGLGEEARGMFGKKQIPVYLSLSESAPQTAPIHQLQFPISFVGEGSFFGLKISGDRMDRASLPDGSIAIIRQQTFADDGEIVAVSLGDNPVFISRYYRIGENIILLSESSNPMYRPVIINPREQTVKIHGKVTKSIQSVF